IHHCLKSAEGHEQQRALFDEKFLFRHLPGILSPIEWETWGQHYPQPARPENREAILDLVLRAEGKESTRIAERWLDRQPEGFYVLRRQDGEIRGFFTLLNLSRESPQDIAADPGTRAAWDYAQRHAPPRPNETVTQCRFVIDRQAYQDPSPTLNAAPIVSIQRYLSSQNLAWDFVTLAEPERWDDYFAVADLPRAVGADFTVGGRRYGLFAHDFRQRPVDAWLELVTERALTRDFTSPASIAQPQIFVLSQPEFDEAVRQALRDLSRPDLLAHNPLLRTRLARDHAGNEEPNAAGLEALIRGAAATLSGHPRDDKLFRAVDRTYLRPAATQERAAAALSLPFSTYRRHLTQGVERVVRWLWDREVYGTVEHS
ncbi:MAG: ATP-binding protein, partial [Actinomycetota bacterium]|nr:ATP-binding protein [Actinomycetota bacterium]MDQ3899983.1 ATP-binding protein [Actinomycetota bacterium]